MRRHRRHCAGGELPRCERQHPADLSAAGDRAGDDVHAGGSLVCRVGTAHPTTGSSPKLWVIVWHSRPRLCSARLGTAEAAVPHGSSTLDALATVLSWSLYYKGGHFFIGL